VPPSKHQGKRIVHGARLVQAETDILLGWTSIDGRDYIVRQFRNRKGEIDATTLKRDDLDDYGRFAGALLARAHTRSVDPRLLAGYCEEDGEDLDEAFAKYAVDYADQTESDHAKLVAEVRAGRLPALIEED
jgi:predicted RNA-binding Zn ribbon-like protein